MGRFYFVMHSLLNRWLRYVGVHRMLLNEFVCVQDCSFPAYFYTQPMATGPGFYDNLCPQSWQDGSAATFTLQDPHQQTFDCPGN